MILPTSDERSAASSERAVAPADLPDLGPRYRIQQELGRGGMGRVFVARDLHLDRQVAIKLLATGAHREEELRRFAQEARAAGSLNHPNILAVHDIGSCEAGPYIVSELLDGSTLRERLDGKPLPLKAAQRYTVELAKGLAAAHEHGVIHCDVKPENLFITNEGRLKILDFGLAKLTGARFVAPESQVQSPPASINIRPILGTVEYMSPEQVRGREADHRSDIFSTGAVLYEMLAGQRPFQRQTPIETGTAILNDNPPDLPPQVSLELDRIVRRCLEKSRERRYQSAKDLALDLEQAALHPVRSARASAMRRWRALVLLAVVAAAVSAGVVAGAWVWRAQRPEFRQLSFRRGTIYSARFASDGETIVYAAAWEGALRPEIFSSRVHGPESKSFGLQNANVLSLSRTGELLVQLGVRRETWRTTGTLARVPLAGGAPREVVDGVSEADWAPDGATFAVARDVGGRNRIEFPLGKVLFETTGWVSHLRISPRGDRLAFLHHSGTGSGGGTRYTKWASVAVIDLAGKMRTLVPTFIAQGLAWSPTGDEIWFTMAEPGKREALRAVTLSGRERTLVSVPGSLRLLDVDRAGRILLAHESVRLVLSALPPGEQKERELSWFDWALLGDLSSDGTTVLFTEQTSPHGAARIYLRKTDGSPPVLLGEGLGTALSPDGNWVFAVVGQPGRLVLLPTGSGQPQPVPSGDIEALTGRWSGDGKRMVIAGREPGHAPRLYALGEGPPKGITPEGISLIYAVSPDGSFVAARDAEGRSALYPLSEGEPQPIRELDKGDYPFAWSKDGRSLYAFRHGEVPCTVYRLELATRRKDVWRVLAPADLTGVPNIGRVQITPDARAYAYGHVRQLSELFLVEGLK
jgi:Tol biopolymer transport system component